MADKNCKHLFCPHQHYKKCLTERQRKIELSIKFPHKTQKADLTTNRLVSSVSKNKTSNISTLAYENYSIQKVIPAQQDTNFSKNFYLENCPDRINLSNKIVDETKEELNCQSAYVLAAGATKDYERFAKQRQNHLFNARQRAQVAYLEYFEAKRQQKSTMIQEQKKWVIDYIRKVQSFIEHLLGTEKIDDANIKEKQFLKQNMDKSAKTLKEIKVADPSTALEILTSMRAVLLRRKEALAAEREEQEHHKSMTASGIDQSSTQNMSQTASFISVATNEGDQMQGEAHFAEKYCDFQSLQKKWGVVEVNQIKNILRRLLCNNLVNKAEGHHMREKKKQNDKNALIRKQLIAMGHSVPLKKDKTKIKEAKNNLKYSKSTHNHSQSIPFNKDSLDKQEGQVKKAIMNGGQFDAIGDIFTRNRNYSQLFKKRTAECSFSLSFSQQRKFIAPSTQRTYPKNEVIIPTEKSFTSTKRKNYRENE